eukprot:scaffold278717_cov19-Tisochrysis_lutea.AAC.1
MGGWEWRFGGQELGFMPQQIREHAKNACSGASSLGPQPYMGPYPVWKLPIITELNPGGLKSLSLGIQLVDELTKSRRAGFLH